MNKDKFLNSAEVKHLEQVLMDNIKTSTRDCLLLLLALKTGARATEILNIKKTDLNTHEKSILIYGIKNSNNREIPIQPKLFTVLLQYVNTVQGDFVFPISYERFVQIWHNFRPVQKKLHSLRHTMGITLYERTKNIHLVKTALGHKSIQNTMCYLDFVESRQQLRKAMVR